jgi:hypothetical protein
MERKGYRKERGKERKGKMWEGMEMGKRQRKEGKERKKGKMWERKGSKPRSCMRML